MDDRRAELRENIETAQLITQQYIQEVTDPETKHALDAVEARLSIIERELLSRLGRENE